MADNADDVAAKLAVAAADKAVSEPSTEEKTVVKTNEKPEEVAEKAKTPEPVPYERFKEVNETFKTAKTEWGTAETALKTSLEQAQKTASDLTNVVQQGQKDADLVSALRGLSQNPKYSGLIEKVDAALAGVDLEEESGEKTPEQAQTERTKIADNMQETFRAELDEQRNELMLQRADLIAKEYLSELPEEYQAVDKTVLSEMWANRLDWDEVMKTPNQLSEKLKTSLEGALKAYGEPRGKLVAATAGSELENATKTPETPAETIEEQMAKYIGKDYGAVKTVDGKTVSEVSDDEFDADFAKSLRLLQDQ